MTQETQQSSVPEHASNEMRTENNDLAFESTKHPLVDLFYELEDVVAAKRLSFLLDNAWAFDATATLKLIFNARSIHLGKSSQNVFYRCCGWLADKHPQTLVFNLQWLSRPLIPKKPANQKNKDTTEDDDYEYINIDSMTLEDVENPLKYDVKNGVAHGYWKDMLSILLLSAHDKLHDRCDPSEILNVHGEKTPRKREWNHEKAKEASDAKKEKLFSQVQKKLQEDPLYKALQLTVARLFGDQLKRDQKNLESNKTRELSLGAKWAPNHKGAHDRGTLIVSTIAEYMFERKAICPEVEDRQLYLRHAREAYRMTVSPLRKKLEVVERDITAEQFSNIKYERVPSLAMNRYGNLFMTKDGDRYGQYIEKVAQGKAKISGAVLLPSTLVKQARDTRISLFGSAKSSKELIAQKIKKMEASRVDSQWKTLVQRIRDSGTLENSIAVCDVSGSMCTPTFKDGTCPMDSSLGLSVLLAEITKPPFGGQFITFSSRPEMQKLEGDTLSANIQQMERSAWTMNTNFVAVFEDLLLPMAQGHKVTDENMVKQVFVFSDMQFDECGGESWSNSFEKIQHKYKQAGYHMPKLIFWNLAGGRIGLASKPTLAEQDDVALVSGYSQGQLKMFLDNGQFEEPEAEVEITDVEEEGDGEDDAVVVERKVKKPKLDPKAMMKKAISHKAYDMLKVYD